MLKERIEKLEVLPINSGGHKGMEAGHCAMELVSWLADETFSDHPQCTCPVLGSYVRAWNDALPNDAEDRMILVGAQ